MLPFSPLFLELLILTHLLLQCPGRSEWFLAFNNKQLLFWFYIFFVIKAWTPLTIILHVIIIKIIQEVFLSAAILACVSSSKLSSSSLSQSSKFSRPLVTQSWRILVKTLDLFKELFAPVAFADLECLPHLVFTTRVFHSLHHGSCLIIGGLLFPLRNSCLANWKTLSILGDSNLKMSSFPTSKWTSSVMLDHFSFGFQPNMFEQTQVFWALSGTIFPQMNSFFWLRCQASFRAKLRGIFVLVKVCQAVIWGLGHCE